MIGLVNTVAAQDNDDGERQEHGVSRGQGGILIWSGAVKGAVTQEG
jgi:hypothetical protein